MPIPSPSLATLADAVPVLFYDGQCGLCNRIVRVLLRIDQKARLRFSPLQSPLAQRYLQAQGLPTTDFDSIILVPDWSRPDQIRPRFRTDAALAALALCGGPWQTLAAILRVVPAPLRDAGYKLIARFRYRLFGPYCPTKLPNPAWADRFLQG